MKDKEIMLDFNEEKHAERYCNKMGCNKCNESNESGDYESYGCKGQDDYVEARYQSILKKRKKAIKAAFSAAERGE